jgi:hypothetical protein
MTNLIKVVCVRVTPELYSKLRTVSDARGEDVSDFIRRAILKELGTLNFLSINQKKALGMELAAN